MRTTRGPAGADADAEHRMQQEIRKLIAVGTAGSQLRAPDRSGHWRRSPASSRSQWALPDVTRERQIEVGTAGPELRTRDPSWHCRTSIASSRAQRALPVRSYYVAGAIFGNLEVPDSVTVLIFDLVHGHPLASMPLVHFSWLARYFRDLEWGQLGSERRLWEVWVPTCNPYLQKSQSGFDRAWWGAAKFRISCFVKSKDRCVKLFGAMDSTLKNGINGLLTDKPLLPRVIEFVKASGAGISQKSKDVEDEPPQPQYSLFSRERFLSLFEEVSPRRVGRGLYNLGNTCFFNSVLQVLMYTGPLQRFLLSKQHSAECKCKRESTVCTLCLLESHALEVFDSNKAPMRPAKLLKHMPQIASRFKAHGRQEDAHEFLIHFLDACHKSLLKQAAQQPVPRPVQQTTSICQLFGGFLRSQVLCLKCKHPSNTFDPFMDISLEVNNASTLEKALDAFTKSEQLRGANKYQCKKCQQKVDATKTFSIHTAPPVLSFQLKRFDFLHGFRGKLKKKVQFPVSLNIAPYTSQKNREEKYNLYGLVVHCGSSAKSGHYIAYAKHNGSWYCFNDQDVRQVKEQQVLREEAYLLFYQAAKSPQPPQASPDTPNLLAQLASQKEAGRILASVQQAASDLNKEIKEHCLTNGKVHNGTSLNAFKHNGEHLKEVNLGPLQRPKVKRLRLSEKKEKSESSEKEHSEQSSQSDRKKEIGRIPRSRSKPLLKLKFYQDRLGTEKRKASATGDDRLAPLTLPPKKQKVEQQDVAERVAATTNYTQQYGQAEVDHWDDVDTQRDSKTFEEAQEKMQPRVQRRDALDKDYDVGKKKHKPKQAKAEFNGRSAFDQEATFRAEAKCALDLFDGILFLRFAVCTSSSEGEKRKLEVEAKAVKAKEAKEVKAKEAKEAKERAKEKEKAESPKERASVEASAFRHWKGRRFLTGMYFR
eukprot:s675_g13.t3